MKSWMLRVLVMGSVLGLGSLAHASVDVRYQAGAGGNDSVQVLLSADAEGGAVSLPIGSVVSTGDLQQQDLVLGQAIEVDLQPNERRTVTVPAYCMHSSRSVPSPGGGMQAAGNAEAPLEQLMAVQHLFPHHVMQQAVWAYRDGNAVSDEYVRKVFLVANVAVKN